MEEGKLNWSLTVSDLFALSELYLREKRQIFDTIAALSPEDTSFSSTLGTCFAVVVVVVVVVVYVCGVSRSAGEVRQGVALPC